MAPIVPVSGPNPDPEQRPAADRPKKRSGAKQSPESEDEDEILDADKASDQEHPQDDNPQPGTIDVLA